MMFQCTTHLPHGLPIFVCGIFWMNEYYCFMGYKWCSIEFNNYVEVKMGFTLEFHKRFKIMTACGMRQYHPYEENLGSVLAKPDKNDFPKFWWNIKQNLCSECVEGITDTWFFILLMAAFNLSDASLYRRCVFGITSPLYNVSFMRDQTVLIFPDCLLFNVPTNILILSKF